MAKSDFCFTYYDGDAASDTAHMNRLERGCYHDLVLFQRKIKGSLTLDQIKKILGKDFEQCWPSLELILKKDSEKKFFIEWLDNSEKKSKIHSKKQKSNVTKRYQTDTNQIPKPNFSLPLGDGNGDRDESINEDWIKWGNQILKEEDQFWEQMKGRKITQPDLDNFISVAIRNDWKMESQQSFRYTLKGFQPMKVNGQKIDQPKWRP